MQNDQEDVHQIGLKIVSDEFTPKFVVITDNGKIVSVSSGVEQYLGPNEGVFQNNISKLVVGSLRAPLYASLKSAQTNKNIARNFSVMKTENGMMRVEVSVRPILEKDLFLVVFRDLEYFESEDIRSNPDIITSLESELSHLKEELDKSIQELERSNTELKTTNEELLSINEELYATNEELESSRKEIQSGNERLIRTNIDLENLLNSTKIATIFLDNELRIKSFTPYVDQIYDFHPQDIGREIGSFQSKAISMPTYTKPQNLKSNEVIETQVFMPDGKIFLRRKSAYLDKAKQQTGLVITFVDVTDLRRSEEMFRTLANTVPQMIWSTDEKGNYIYFSEQWKDFSGLDPSVIQNKGFRQIIHPDDIDLAMREWEKVQQTADEFNHEYRLRDKYGEYHWHLLKAKSIKDRTDKIIKWFGTCTNIQGRKNLELSNLRTQERLENVTRAVDLGVWFCNLPFSELEWSDIVKKHFWCEGLEKITLETFYSRIHPDDRENVRESIDNSIKNHIAYDSTFRTLDPHSHNMKWVRSIGWTDYDEEGLPKTFDGVTLDITNEVEAMNLLKTSEWRYSMASKAARELIWDWDLKTDEVIWNESLSKEFGYSNEERYSDGNWWINHIHPDDKQRVSDSIHETIHEKKSFWQSEYRFRRVDDSYAYVRDKGFLQLDDSGNAIRMIGTMYDQTEVLNSLDQLKEAVRSRDEFLSIASHELKTPLTSMVLQHQMLKRKLENPHLDINFIKRANDLSLKQCRHLTSLIEDMLDVSRISNGKMTFDFGPVKVSEIVRTALETFSFNFEEKNLGVSLRIEEDAVIIADPFRFEQVVNNLLSNAIKYGGNRPIEISISARENQAIIEVKDYGIGIEKEKIQRIFNLFERAISSTSISGLGLGLYISKQIVNSHQGTIEVESEIGKGSAFRVIVPIAKST